MNDIARSHAGGERFPPVPSKTGIFPSCWFLAVAIGLAATLLHPPLIAGEHTSRVNPFVGTAKGGNTFPGAVRPWGMVSVSPHNDLAAPSGYIHGRPYLFGFGHTHLSGTGCADLGSILVAVARERTTPTPDAWKNTYSDESAAPGYYAVRLPEPAIGVEATVTPRCGFLRFVPENEGAFTVFIDAGRSLALVGGGAITVVSANEVEGYNVSGGFCGESNRQTLFFVSRFSRPASATGIWKGTSWSRGKSALAPDTPIGAWLEFEADVGEEVVVTTGVSYVSIANARKNLDAEGSVSFDQARADADSAWDREMGRIEVEGGSAADLTTFYSALYHVLIHPNVINDVNGDYPMMGGKRIGRTANGDRYTVFSLWDTYRTLHPFLALVYPERQRAMVQTMVDMYTESGWLPKWELAGNETHMMVGDPASIVVVDTYLKGIQPANILTAYEAILRPTVDTSANAEAARPGYRQFLDCGYIPVDQDTTREWWVWGPVSTLLEYCLADWCIARLAGALGDTTAEQEYAARSCSYRNLFDTTTSFLRPRRQDGSWLTPFDPLQTEGSGNWSGSGGPGYVEGNAWNYTFFVPHDIEGLATLLGGKEPFARKLDTCFARGLFTITNEPDIAYPYLFTYCRGEEYRTQQLIRSIIRRDFGTGPDGLPGNDDAGAISAWVLFSALGFYPACPGSGEYRIGIPLFTRVTVRVGDHTGTATALTIERAEGDDDRPFTATWNGRVLEKFSVRHEDLVRGGTLLFSPR